MSIKTRIEKLEERVKGGNGTQSGGDDPLWERLVHALVMHSQCGPMIEQDWRDGLTGLHGSRTKEWLKKKIQEYIEQGGADDEEAFIEYLEREAEEAQKVY